MKWSWSCFFILRQYSLGFDVINVLSNCPNISFAKKSTGAYRSGFTVLELENVPGGVYNITPSTFEPGQEGPYFITVQSSCPIKLSRLQWTQQIQKISSLFSPSHFAIFYQLLHQFSLRLPSVFFAPYIFGADSKSFPFSFRLKKFDKQKVFLFLRFRRMAFVAWCANGFFSPLWFPFCCFALSFFYLSLSNATKDDVWTIFWHKIWRGVVLRVLHRFKRFNL